MTPIRPVSDEHRHEPADYELEPNELAACPNPWCESHEHGAVPHAPEDLWNIEGSNATRVQCPSCYMVGPHRMTEAEAIAAWNRRVS